MGSVRAPAAAAQRRLGALARRSGAAGALRGAGGGLPEGQRRRDGREPKGRGSEKGHGGARLRGASHAEARTRGHVEGQGGA